jgi:NAD(P)H-dependent FMN reductase
MLVVGISGSLRAASTNGRLLLAATAFVPPGTTMVISSPLRDLPPFDPDVAPESRPAVAAWVHEIREADALIVSTPEYARGYPGSLKNAFDWLVGTDAFIEKPFMLLSASPRATVAQQTLTTVLEAMSGIHVSAASTTLPLLGTDLDATQIRDDPVFSEKLRSALKTFIAEIENR